MGIFAKDSGADYVPAPEGLQQGVCCDVIDLGDVVSTFTGKMQHKVRIVWQSEHQHPNPNYNRPHEVSNTYSLSLHEKATLRKHLEAWRGKKFTPEELKGFDLEKLIGVNCQLQVVHKLASNGATYANIQAIVPIGKGMPPLKVSASYTRKKDRDGYEEPSANGHVAEPPSDVNDENVPF